ncbi:hypothetical protein K1X09_29695 [Paenibacillus lautus]|nr:hypothetical protein [Paenibacillus lautus]
MKFRRVLAWFVLVIVIGCSGLSKIAVPEDLLAEGEDELRIHYFYEDAHAANELDEQARIVWWSEEVDDMSDTDTEVLQATMLHNVREENAKQKAETLGLRRFPFFVVVNHKEIALKTADLNEVVDFLKKNR